MFGCEPLSIGMIDFPFVCIINDLFILQTITYFIRLSEIKVPMFWYNFKGSAENRNKRFNPKTCCYASSCSVSR